MPRSLSSPRPLFSLRWPSLLLLSAAAAAQTGRDTEAFQMGLGLMQRQLHDEASKQFARFLEASPQHELAAEAHYRLACCRLELSDAKAAATSLQAALQRGGARFKLRPEALYRLGTAQHQLGDHAAGQRALTELLAAIDAAHYLRAPGLFAAGECLRDLQRDAEAVASFLAAAAADQDPAGGYAMPARYQAGFAQLRLGKFGDAEATFRTAAQAHPEHAAAAECWYLAGDAAFRAGHFDAAVAAFDASGKVAGEFADDAALGLAWAQLQRSDRPAARAAFTAVFERHANSPLAGKARLELGRLQQQDGEHDAAAQTLAPLLTSEAKDLRGEASEIVGLAAAARGDHEGALPRLTAALELAAPAAQPRILVAIGAAHAARSEWQPALDAYQRAAGATQEPELHGEADYGACLALHKLGKFGESQALAQRLLAAQPPHRLREHAALAVAENLFATKAYREAEAAYTPLDREGGPFQRDARFKRAWSVYLQGKRQREAADLFASLAEGKTLLAEGKTLPHAEEALSMAALAALEGGDAERAIECADRYKLRYPKGSFLARTERVASRSLQGKGDLAGAAQRLTAAASLEGDGERGRQDRLEVAELLFKKSDFTAAMGAYDALAAGGDAVAARALEGAGWCAFELGDDPLALQRVDQALAHAQLGERLADGLQLRCAVLQRMQRWDDAAATAQRFAKECGKDPRLPAMQYALGLAQARGGKPDPARQTLRALLEAGGGPNPDRTAYELAWAHRKAGDEPAALAAFTRVLELTKDVELAGEARLHLGEAALAANQSEAAAKLFAEVRGQYRARALYRLGFDRLSRDPKAAQAVFAQLLDEKLTGSFADDARFLVGEAAHRAGDHTAATAACLDALQKLPEHERAQLARVRGGESAVRAGKVGEAVAVLEEFVRRDRGEGEAAKLERARALLWLGQARAERQEWKPAIVAFQQVTDLTDTEFAAQAQFRMGLARKAQGDLDGAVDAFVKLSILYGHAEWVQRGLYETAVCYTELKQPAKAEKFIAELAQRFPDSPWTAKAKGQGTQPKAPR